MGVSSIQHHQLYYYIQVDGVQTKLPFESFCSIPSYVDMIGYDANKPCVFPFVYKNIKYYGCMPLTESVSIGILRNSSANLCDGPVKIYIS